MTRLPPLPLHPSVYTLALQQLSMGANLTEIQATNRHLFKDCGYKDQPRDLKESQHRWLLQKSDSWSLSWQHNRLRGVHTIVPPHINVHGWCDVTSPSYKPELAAAILHYSAHADKGDHFEVCIATQEMCDAAWRYGHQSQIILDGTFGVCDCKLAQC